MLGGDRSRDFESFFRLFVFLLSWHASSGTNLRSHVCHVEPGGPAPNLCQTSRFPTLGKVWKHAVPAIDYCVTLRINHAFDDDNYDEDTHDEDDDENDGCDLDSERSVGTSRQWLHGLQRCSCLLQVATVSHENLRIAIFTMLQYEDLKLS